MIPSLNLSLEPKNDSVICSLASAPLYETMLEITKPTLEYYAKLHKMDTFVSSIDYQVDSLRPPVWNKIALINNLLKHYKMVFWIDCDAIIVNPERDIRLDLNQQYPMHLVTHYGIQPNNPNTGVWVLENDPRVIVLLEDMWSRTDMVSNPWWDQGVLLNLLGYGLTHAYKDYWGPTKYTNLVGDLDLKWNSRPLEQVQNPYIEHFSGLKYHERLEKLKEKYQEFLIRIQND